MGNRKKKQAGKQMASESAMERLPSELLCFILSKLDGHSLACAAKVCHRWHSVVHDLGKGFNIWYKRCLEELGLDAIVAQTGLTQLLTVPGRTEAELRRDSWEFWKKVYAVNRHCDCVGSEKWKSKSERRNKAGGLVTGVALAAPTATRKGMLWLGFQSGYIDGTPVEEDWHWVFRDVGLYSDHINGCTDMTTVRLGGCHGYSTGAMEPEVFVVSTGFDGFVKISDRLGRLQASLRPQYHQACCVSALGPYFVVGHDSSITRGLVIYKIVPRAEAWRSVNGTLVSVVAVMKLSGLMYSNVKAVALAHNQVVAGDEQGVLYNWTIPSLSNFDGLTGPVSSRSDALPDTVVTVDKPTNTIQLSKAIDKILIHRNQVIVLVGVGLGSMCIINNDDWSKMSRIGEEKITSMARNGGYVCSIAASGSLLAVGCRSGEVMLFRIASRDWPSNLTQSLISCFPSNMLNMTTLTFSDDGRGTVLLAAGCYLCCFQWRKQWENRDENRITPWKSEHRVTRFSSSRHVDEMCAELQGI